MPFGFLPDSAFGFAGIPTGLAKDRLQVFESEITLR
jgi:hypothetical protein